MLANFGPTPHGPPAPRGAGRSARGSDGCARPTAFPLRRCRGSSGSPLVLVHGGFADGETAWVSLLPHLTGQFTCYTMSLRGRGLSEPADDLSIERAVEDVASFVESIGEPAGLMGLSSGALLSLGGAENTGAVSAVVAYEPPAFDLMPQDVSEAYIDTLARVGELAAEGKPTDAVRTFIERVTNDSELSTLRAQGDAFFEALAANIPTQLQEMKQFAEHEGPFPADPDELARVTSPSCSRTGPHRNAPTPGWSTV